MLKKIICLFLFMSFILCGCSKKQETQSNLNNIIKRGKLIAGVRVDAKPFGFVDKNGKYQGYDVELAERLAKSILNSEGAVEFVPVTAQNRISVLNSGKVDVLIATVSITDNRKILMDFSSPYYIAGQAVLVNEGSKIGTLRELNGKRVIIVYGSTGEMSVRRAIPEAVVYGYKTYPEAIAALKAGKAEALISDDTILYGLAYGDKSVKILPGRYSNEPYAVAFRKGKESDRLREHTNFFLQQLARTGKLTKMQEKWEIK